jgi:hypothetical protein
MLLLGKSASLISDKDVTDSSSVPAVCNPVSSAPIGTYNVFLARGFLNKGKGAWKIPVTILVDKSNQLVFHRQFKTQTPCASILDDEHFKGLTEADIQNGARYTTSTAQVPPVFYWFVDCLNYPAPEGFEFSPKFSTNDTSGVGGFQQWMATKMNPDAPILSTTASLGIGGMLAALAATGLGIYMARQQTKSRQKDKRVHKYHFNSNEPNYHEVLPTQRSMAPDDVHSQPWRDYRKAVKMAATHIRLELPAQPAKVAEFLTKYRRALFPVPAWTAADFLDNQARLTTVVLYLQPGHPRLAEAALDFWQQFKDQKLLRRKDFVRQLQKHTD